MTPRFLKVVGGDKEPPESMEHWNQQQHRALPLVLEGQSSRALTRRWTHNS